ncbi:protein takeout-like [Anticarsia gemmatalis]|uniref:protein takeout-like n=1 Tax=Anticarsia gemmatalis TaxID=129554 RepID=UPI003F76DFDB
MLSTRLLVLAVLCCQNVWGKQVICDFENTNCVTEGARRIYQEFVNGEVKGVPSSGTMFAELIEVELPSIKYTLRNSTFSGLKNCVPEFVSINTKEKSYQYNLACKHITMQGKYVVNGKVGPMDVEGNGDYKVDHYDYVFQLFGGCVPFVKDDKLHIKITKEFKLDIDARGKVTYEYTNLYNGDKEKSDAMHKFANENWRLVDKTIRQPFMEKFMALFVEHANTYLDILPIEHFFYEEVLD